MAFIQHNSDRRSTRMQNNVIVIDDSDDDVKVCDENAKLIKELSKRDVISIFDGFQVKPVYWNNDNVFPLFLDEALRDNDASYHNTVIADSNIANSGKGLFTTVDVPLNHQYAYSGVLRLRHEENDSEEQVFYDIMKHRSVKTMLQPFLHFGIRMYVVGSYNCAATYMNDLDYGAEEPPSRTLNNCIIVGMPYGDEDTLTVADVKAWLKNNPVRVETVVAVPAGHELVTSYRYRCAEVDIEDNASSDNDRASDSDWEP